MSLEEHECWECGKPTIVARISPCRESEKLTGMWLCRFTIDEQKTIGVLCVGCAFRLCDEGKVSLGFSGGYLGNLDNWEALLSEIS